MLDRLKLALGITGSDKDELLRFVLDTVVDEILNYCNLEELPTRLENIAVRMATDLWRSEGYGSESKPQAVKSISRGDVSTSFTDTSTGEVKGIKAIMDDYTAQLNAFRKLRW
ncbi:phage head-tail connector protein [Paenibacillus alvei]|uniref:Phage head-tail connector protein n=1 Tax=Paenibacillus alvei TaxID=44250 RepID=A0ABT4H844_PAEAL|nr:phage head-tail connector protein [Paenibacillus alvei]MCY9764784.1 phage head-tail connector protein [Paenibacillus alvei]MCY9770691.1 phage head-tail connector protein [Paenibacillus alvei]